MYIPCRDNQLKVLISFNAVENVFERMFKILEILFSVICDGIQTFNLNVFGMKIPLHVNRLSWSFIFHIFAAVFLCMHSEKVL